MRAAGLLLHRQFARFAPGRRAGWSYYPVALLPSGAPIGLSHCRRSLVPETPEAYPGAISPFLFIFHFLSFWVIDRPIIAWYKGNMATPKDSIKRTIYLSPAINEQVKAHILKVHGRKVKAFSIIVSEALTEYMRRRTT